MLYCTQSTMCNTNGTCFELGLGRFDPIRLLITSALGMTDEECGDFAAHNKQREDLLW